MLTPEEIKMYRQQIGLEDPVLEPTPDNVEERIRLRQERVAKITNPKPLPKPGFFAQVGQALSKRGDQIQAATDRNLRGEQNVLEGFLQTAGAAAGAVGDIAGEAARGVYHLLPDDIEKSINKGASAAGKAFLNTKLGQEGLTALQNGMDHYTEWSQKNPRAAANLESVVNIASLYPIGLGGKVVSKAGTSAIKTGAEVAETALKPVKTKVAANLIKSAEKTTESLLAPTKETTKRATQKILPELTERLPIAKSPQELAGKLRGNAEKAGQAISDFLEENQLKGSIKKQQLLDTLEQAKSDFMVGGRVVEQEPVNLIDNLKTIINQFDDDIDADTMRSLRQVFDTTISKGQGYLKTTAEGTAIDLRKKLTAVLREELAKNNPDLAKLNKEFHLWNTAADVMEQTAQRKVGQSGALRKVGDLAVGAMIGSGGGLASSAGWALVMRALGEVTTSTSWKTASIAIKRRLARQIAGQEWDAVEKTLKGLGAGYNPKESQIQLRAKDTSTAKMAAPNPKNIQAPTNATPANKNGISSPLDLQGKPSTSSGKVNSPKVSAPKGATERVYYRGGGKGNWITENRDYAKEYGKVSEYTLTREPRLLSAGYDEADEIADLLDVDPTDIYYNPTKELRAELAKRGYDGFEHGDNIYISNESILKPKSATLKSLTTESQLHQKARKYESAEEFVKGQGKVMYHSTDSEAFNVFDPSKAAKGETYFNPLGDGLFLSKDKEFTRRFGKNTFEYVLPKNAKTKVITDQRFQVREYPAAVKGTLRKLGIKYDDLDLNDKVMINHLVENNPPIQALNEVEFLIREDIAPKFGVKLKPNQVKEIMQGLMTERNAPYDAVIYRSTDDLYGMADEIIIPKAKVPNLRTKSQLTSIWEEANKNNIGPVFSGIKSVGQAIKKLLSAKTGEVKGIVKRPDLGEIDLIYGKPGPSGFGIAKIQSEHPDIIPRLPKLLEQGELLPGGTRRRFLKLNDDRGVIALDYNGEKKSWVLTAYKKNPAGRGGETPPTR